MVRLMIADIAFKVCLVSLIICLPATMLTAEPAFPDIEKNTWVEIFPTYLEPADGGYHAQRRHRSDTCPECG